MDFQDAVNNGYYFDRCIDLEFLNNKYEVLAKLNCPKRGMKPSITIKGNLIESNYGVDCYISVQNMAFDIDIQAISYVVAKMYYSGIYENTSEKSAYAQQMKGSKHEIIFSVLYTDQEKEPPHRAVRFQCVVASRDITRTGVLVYGEGGKVSLDSTEIEIKDKTETTTSLPNIIKNLAELYNKSVKTNIPERRLHDSLLIKNIVIDASLMDTNVVINQTKDTFLGFVRLLNSYSETGGTWVKYKIALTGKNILVTRQVPDDWQLLAVSEGKLTEEEQTQWFNETFMSPNTVTINLESDMYTVDANKPIPLNFVKSATRSENVITCTTMFDDRIYPGCTLKIKGTSIMGKVGHGGKSSQRGSRIIVAPEYVTFRSTGAIEFIFSTTEDSYMKIIGPTVTYKEDKVQLFNEGAE